MKHNENNERIKRTYFAYLKEAQRHSEQSIDTVSTALARFETYNRHRDFKTFHHQQSVGFKRHLAERLSHKTGDKLSKSTVRATLAALRTFFIWLAFQPGYRSRFSASDADYFNPSDRDIRIALASRPRSVPSMEQIKHALSLMPAETVLDRRDRALLAFILLTGCRDRAAISLKLKHVDPTRSLVFQDAREVQTKFGKSIATYFFPVGDEPRQIVTDWISELTTTHFFGPDDPLFPCTKIEPSAEHLFHATGIERRHWSNADPVRRIFRKAFERAGLPYFNPHSLRHTLARLGEQRCKSAEEMKAWSQNLGHEQMLTTFTSYGRIEEHRQGEIIKSLNQAEPNGDAMRDLFQKLMAQLPRS